VCEHYELDETVQLDKELTTEVFQQLGFLTNKQGLESLAFDQLWA
jgi:hypothetical protein